MTKQIDQITKEAYQVKSAVILKQSVAKLPMHVFVDSVNDRIVQGSLRRLLRLTTDKPHDNEGSEGDADSD